MHFLSGERVQIVSDCSNENKRQQPSSWTTCKCGGGATGCTRGPRVTQTPGRRSSGPRPSRSPSTGRIVVFLDDVTLAQKLIRLSLLSFSTSFAFSRPPLHLQGDSSGRSDLALTCIFDVPPRLPVASVAAHLLPELWELSQREVLTFN